MAENENKGMFEKLAGNDKYRRIALTVGVLGIALIFLSGLFQPPEKKRETSPQLQQTAQQYAVGLEESLTALVENIQGAGTAKVLVTLERSAEQVYATAGKKSTQTAQSETSNDSSETSYILIKDGDGAQRALEITEVQPIIKGVVIVCDGGNSPTVQQNIINAVTTALDLSSARVCVIKSK